jgi:hypothetical protein
MNNNATPQGNVKQVEPSVKPAQLDKFYHQVLKGFGYDYQRTTPRG